MCQKCCALALVFWLALIPPKLSDARPGDNLYLPPTSFLEVALCKSTSASGWIKREHGFWPGPAYEKEKPSNVVYRR